MEEVEDFCDCVLRLKEKLQAETLCSLQKNLLLALNECESPASLHEGLALKKTSMAGKAYGMRHGNLAWQLGLSQGRARLKDGNLFGKDKESLGKAWRLVKAKGSRLRVFGN